MKEPASFLQLARAWLTLFLSLSLRKELFSLSINLSIGHLLELTASLFILLVLLPSPVFISSELHSPPPPLRNALREDAALRIRFL